MMMTRRSERMARPLQMTAGMQVQSAIASRLAYGRVCAQLSCMILHALTLQHLSQPAQRGGRSPPLLHRCHCCLVVARRPVRQCAFDGRPESCVHARLKVGPLRRLLPHCSATRYARHHADATRGWLRGGSTSCAPGRRSHKTLPTLSAHCLWGAQRASPPLASAGALSDRGRHSSPASDIPM